MFASFTRSAGAAFALTALLMSSPALADSEAERQAAAKTYIEATLEDLDMASVVENMWKPVVDQFRAQGTEVTEAKIEALRTLYADRFTEPMYEVMRAQASVMADVYTLDEINALAAFYQTEHGKAAITKMPKLMERQMPQILSMVQREMPEVLPEVMKIMQGE
ncbi:DUF2059 domain-containing protein [Aliiroseovarius marinus]|uniref:DUF2059 domain-containing protein n=1 Tax=Aliiroseovarius marinus TaxID=2500159 RepID=UPI003D7ED94A